MRELATLVREAQGGDGGAFGEVVRRMQDMAYGAAFARLADHHLAQDAAQEAFIEAFLHLGQLQEPAAFPGWFRQILFRQCFRLTRRRPLRAVPLEDVLELPGSEPTPAQVAEARDLRSAILGALEVLPEHERVVTELFYLGGYSQKEIGEFLEIPITTIKKRLHSARGRLRTRILALVRDTLGYQLPSRDEQFATTICLRGEVAREQSRTARSEVASAGLPC